jgi:flagellar protein FlaG
MTRIVTNAGSVGDHSHEAFRRDAEGSDQQDEEPSAVAGADEPDDVRLIIEGDEAGTGFTYTTINRRTGEVIRQLPRDGLLELGRTPGYAAGALIKARV